LSSISERRLGVGVAGLSRAFALMRDAFALHPGVTLTAAADPRREARGAFTAEFGGRAYESVAQMCEDRDVEAVYVASPHGLHRAHTEAAARAGKHVLVEKPMATTLADASAMIEACARAGVSLTIGHSHAQDGPVRLAHRLIAGGGYGRLRMIHALCATDFLHRPRTPAELDTAQGGGVVFSQAAHQVDMLRLLGGGRLESVQAITGAWDPTRPTEGAYAALLRFEDGAFASATYNGHGLYDSDELMGWVSELGRKRDPAPRPRADRAREAAQKAARAYGAAPLAAPGPAPFHNHFGFLLACCDGADLRLLPDGVALHTPQGRRVERLAPPAIPRGEVIEDWLAACAGTPVVASGAWGLATLEACLALLDSARAGSAVRLRHQSAGPVA
jgi:phthalate 4,5-cis-dihydrodiol dehydrogenase